MALYDSKQILSIFERLLNRTLNAVSDDKVRELEEEKRLRMAQEERGTHLSAGAACYFNFWGLLSAV